MDRARLALALLSLSFALLCFPSRPSTDFEVHRHWKALVYSLPPEKWYTDKSSQWTLDYPPLFAYFEYILATVLSRLHPPIVQLDNHDYNSTTCQTFMRTTVLLTHLLYIMAVYHLANTIKPTIRQLALVILLPALFIVDHIHFQYNALPLAFFILTLSYLIRRQPVLACVSFSMCLNLKHTYLPLTPLVSLALLQIIPSLLTFIACALTVISIFSLCFYPFLSPALLLPLLSRLFPISRGLLHAPWAPNVWSFLALCDLFLRRVFRVSGPSLTTGHIHVLEPYAVLRNPTPLHCIIYVMLSLSPSLLLHYQRNSKESLLLAASLSALSTFLFGWHVHEKAIIPVLIPLAFLSGHFYMPLSIGGQYALLELIRRPAEALVAVPVFFAYHVYGNGWRHYLVGAVLVELLAGNWGVWEALFAGKWAYLPRILVSMYSFAGVFAAYIQLQHRVIRDLWGSFGDVGKGKSE